MSYRSRYDKGDWKAICDVCGRAFKASSLRKRWDSFMVCKDDWEIRQPQDFVRGVVDTQVPPWTRPEVQDTFIAICGPVDDCAIVGVGKAGCAVVGTIPPSWWSPLPSSTFTV